MRSVALGGLFVNNGRRAASVAGERRCAHLAEDCAHEHFLDYYLRLIYSSLITNMVFLFALTE